MDTLTVLDREVYTEADAARLLAVPQGTLHYWLEGGTQGGRQHRPVIRREPTGLRAVTWGEFVEAGLLREYRRESVSLPQLRVFIDVLRERLGVPYPLAHQRPLVGRGMGLLIKAQEASGLDPELWLVRASGDQRVLSVAGAAFVSRVTFSEGQVATYRPGADARSTVRIDPRFRFGRPTVDGVSTAVLYEQSLAGAGERQIAADFDLKLRDVRFALKYEAAVA